MISILNRWRQFGRRYFWPHLLFGMVAASFGLPVLTVNTEPSMPAEASTAGENYLTPINFNTLILLRDSTRRTTFGVDYWHQHAIRTVIRHLSFAMGPQVLPIAEENVPLQAEHLALLSTLNSLLTRESKPPVIIRHLIFRQPPVIIAFSTAMWVCIVQGIRAGPQRLS